MRKLRQPWEIRLRMGKYSVEMAGTPSALRLKMWLHELKIGVFQSSLVLHNFKD